MVGYYAGSTACRASLNLARGDVKTGERFTAPLGPLCVATVDTLDRGEPSDRNTGPPNRYLLPMCKLVLTSADQLLSLAALQSSIIQLPVALPCAAR